MSWTSTGADYATMATGLSVVTATYVWVRKQLYDLRQERAAKRKRNWHGFIAMGQINTWYVRVADEPSGPSSNVLLEVINKDGSPNEQMARSLRLSIEADGMLSRSPTTDEYEFLKHLHNEKGYGKGIAIQ